MDATQPINSDNGGNDMEIALVKMDESEYWDASFVEQAGKIYTYYVFNPNEVTHLCSLTGSYYLHPVALETEKEISDAFYDQIYEAWCLTEPDYYTANIKPDSIEDFDSIEDAIEYYQGNTPYITTS